MERIIVVKRENCEKRIPMEPEFREKVIKLSNENVEQQIRLKREGVTIIYIPSITDHSQLDNLDYTSSGHTGFQEEMNALTNIEIERMWNSV